MEEEKVMEKKMSKKIFKLSEEQKDTSIIEGDSMLNFEERDAEIQYEQPQEVIPISGEIPQIQVPNLPYISMAID